VKLHRSHDLAHFADGRVWRLKRGRDFQGSIRAFRLSIGDAAEQMGKVVTISRDKYRPDVYLWVQFGDGETAPGETCVCGSDRIVRVHQRWARCETCGRLLGLVARDVEAPPGPAATAGAASVYAPPPPRRRAVKRLDHLDNVRLYRHSITADAERCFGVGDRPDGQRQLISITFPLEDGRRIPSAQIPGQWLYTDFRLAPLDSYGPLLDGVDLDSGPQVSWRMDEDPGPQPASDFAEPATG
jgi:hypothetical protein